jgi:hypothetical protein
MEEKETIGAARHAPTYDAESINRAVEKAANDPDFIDYTVGQLKGLRFPAFKDDILDYVRNINANKDVISLLQSLNGYIQFRDEYHVSKSLQENNISKKKEYQITDETRENPDVRIRPTTADRGIKEREAANKREERKDYPEVTPTAMSNFVCDRCGKPFQNQNDLVQHKKFESGTEAVT